jgi:protein-S-isoprenylcysteine O-methyltransferase Ste14
MRDEIATGGEVSMSRLLIFIYGLLAYTVFFLVFLYMIGFVGNFAVPKSVDSGPAVSPVEAIPVNVILVALFAVQHTIMARPAFKSWLTRVIPAPMERSTYVLVASLLLALLFWQWRPMPTLMWEIEQPVLRAALTGLFVIGWIVVLYSTAIIDHFDLFGIRHVYLHLRRRNYSYPPFVVKSLYRMVRHPLMVGFLIAFWSAPTMTAGHLLFSVLLTGYILVGVLFEERDLAQYLGSEYAVYRTETPMFVPTLPSRKSHSAPT